MLDDRIVLLGLLQHREIAAEIHEARVVPFRVADRPAPVLGALPQDLLPNPVLQRLSHERSMLRGDRVVEDFDAVSETAVVRVDSRGRFASTVLVPEDPDGHGQNHGESADDQDQGEQFHQHVSIIRANRTARRNVEGPSPG